MSEISEIIRAMLAEGWDEKTTTKAAIELRKRIETRAQRGSHIAYVRLEQWLHIGATKDWNAALKAERQSWLAGPSGEVLTAPARYGVPDHRKDGTKTGEFQMRLIVVMNRSQVQEALRQQRAQRQAADVSVAVLSYALALLEKHLEAETVYDALLLEGVDPNVDWSEGAL